MEDGDLFPLSSFRLLRLGGKAKRKEHGTKSEAKDSLTHSQLSFARADT